MVGENDEEVRGANTGGRGSWADGQCERDGECADGGGERVGRLDEGSARKEGERKKDGSGLRYVQQSLVMFAWICIWRVSERSSGRSMYEVGVPYFHSTFSGRAGFDSLTHWVSFLNYVPRGYLGIARYSVVGHELREMGDDVILCCTCIPMRSHMRTAQSKIYYEYQYIHTELELNLLTRSYLPKVP